MTVFRLVIRFLGDDFMFLAALKAERIFLSARKFVILVFYVFLTTTVGTFLYFCVQMSS
jgi:hypothetical protein